MNPTDYQKAASRTLIAEPDHEISGCDIMILWCAIGLAGETGEVMEHIKKGICHQHGITPDVISKELGDVLWYAAGLCTLIGLNLEEVMQQNIDKLMKRYPNGWSHEDSKHPVGQG